MNGDKYFYVLDDFLRIHLTQSTQATSREAGWRPSDHRERVMRIVKRLFLHKKPLHRSRTLLQSLTIHTVYEPSFYGLAIASMENTPLAKLKRL
jgi:hypothetical protein